MAEQQDNAPKKGKGKMIAGGGILAALAAGGLALSIDFSEKNTTSTADGAGAGATVSKTVDTKTVGGDDNSKSTGDIKAQGDVTF